MTQDLSQVWCDGWQAACVKFRDHLTEFAQKIGDADSQKHLDELFSVIRHMEKTAFNEMPTISVRKPDPSLFE